MTSRVASVDMIRGAVMVLMAIDHVRVFSGVPAGGPVPSVFLTRWITHFCAPAFVFLAGTSAFLYGRAHADLSRFLLVRGAWLVVLELTLLRLAWTFNFDFTHLMAGVIWVIGWCMILMAAIVKLPLGAIAALGITIVAGHNVMDAHMRELIPTLGDTAAAAISKILYVSFYAGPIALGGGNAGAEGGPAGSGDGASLVVLYSIVPWIGVMMAGYVFGKILALPPARRNRLCLAIGLGAIALFLVLRGFNLYGDPRPWSAPPPDAAATVETPGAPRPMPALLAFLNTTKYPASLAFLLMTLGPVIALIPLLERARGALADLLTIFGRVPFFFYVLHIPLIHLLALAVSAIRSGEVSPWLFTNHPMGNPPAPEGYTWSLPLLYAVWAVAIALLYFACRWFAALKARRDDWWLRYV